ncbi:FAD/NAD(P)-binding protein [Arthrobacter sp. NPDC090010]|uniref:FAD/NAD(P)-binding protein n=1 Tax=Arthrobacter sp. NPDC090010 TaxID=3363942 RepID=UPI003811DE27
MTQTRASLVVAGAGPRVAGVLERLAANAPELLRVPIDVHLVDPYEPGSGRVWRHEQYPGLLLNSRAQDITLFTDASVHCAGPRVEGPSLFEWAGLLSAGGLDPDPADDPALAEVPLRDEAAALGPGSFPSRRLFGAYARWFLRRAVLRLAPRARVTLHRDTVTSVHPAGHDDGGGRLVHLASGTVLSADVVLYSLGHSDARPDARERELSGFAERQGGLYFPPAYTADAEYSAISPGEDVLVSGMGLAFIDLVVLLFEGRGGRFRPRADGSLEYLASGREPRLWAGSRRGVPYHAKPQVPLRGPALDGLRHLTGDAVAALLADDGRRLDFREDLWPLVAQEVARHYYAELFAASPERVSGPWEAFQHRLDTVRWGTPEQEQLLADFIPDPAYRLDFALLDRPLTGLTGGLSERESAVLRHLEDDLFLRSATAHSEQTALFNGFLQAYFALGTLVPVERLDAGAQREITSWWHGFFSFVDSGPPPHRLHELLALHRAGFLRFLGPGLNVRTDESAGLFSGTVPGAGESVHARVFVEARLPEATVTGSRNPALWQLAGSTLGKVAVDSRQRVLTADGEARDRVFAVGPWTSAWGSAAFARPRSNAAPFRENDALARELLRILSGSRAAARATAGPAPRAGEPMTLAGHRPVARTTEGQP